MIMNCESKAGILLYRLSWVLRSAEVHLGSFAALRGSGESGLEEGILCGSPHVVRFLHCRGVSDDLGKCYTLVFDS